MGLIVVIHASQDMSSFNVLKTSASFFPNIL